MPAQDGSIVTPIVTRGLNGRWPVRGGDFVDYYGVDDVTIIWWNPEAEGADEVGAEGMGLYEFANEGKRYGQGEIPEDLGVFDEASSIAVLDEVPTDIAPPTYPSSAGGG
jgi:hypothetical protein